jgi:integrase
MTDQIVSKGRNFRQLKRSTTMEIVPVMSIGEVANLVARQSLLAEYRQSKSQQTLRRQRADIALFEAFLITAGSQIDGLHEELSKWKCVTWGLIKAFNLWQLEQGYATGSINVRLATVKSYCQLAMQAGYITGEDLALIQSVKGYRASVARNIDEKRAVTRQENAKKALPVSLAPIHAKLLKSQPDESRGRRDALIMCLLLDHGLRASEVADLNVDSISLEAGQITIYRHKVHKTQIHQLTPDTYRAAMLYLADCSPEQGPLFVGICSKERISTRSINERVSQIGEAIDIKGLSPHDCRHFYATDAIRNGTDIKSLQDAGGWNSPIMPLRYAESASIANAGVKLSACQEVK